MDIRCLIWTNICQENSVGIFTDVRLRLITENTQAELLTDNAGFLRSLRSTNSPHTNTATCFTLRGGGLASEKA